MKEETRFVVLRHHFDSVEARLTFATLEAAGIPVFLQNGNFADAAWTEAAVLSIVALPLAPPLKRCRRRACGHVFPRQGKGPS